jgi:hypothetical protein
MDDILQKRMDTLCTLLLQTYDTRILKSQPLVVQQMFKNISKNYYNNLLPKDKLLYINANKTLINLVYNCFFKTKPKKQLISGPRSLTLHYSKKYNKTIYIFGESHGYANNCGDDIINIREYLQMLFDTTDVFIDFYLEYGMDTKVTDVIMDKEGNWRESNAPPEVKSFTDEYFFGTLMNQQKVHYINQLRIRFDNCIRVHDKCRWKNTGRFHYMDIRQYNTSIENQPNQFHKVELVLTQFFNGKLIKNPSEIINTLNKIHKMSWDGFKKYIYGNYTEKMHKEIKKSELSLDIIRKWRDDIFELYFDKWKEFKSIDKNVFNILINGSYKKYIELDQKYNNKKLNSSEDALYLKYTQLKSVRSLTKIFLSNMIDIYLMSRIFKTFNTKKNINQPPTSHNIIIYAGWEHSRRYSDFLKSLGFEQLATAKEHSTRCLDMTDFPQPFFH